MSSFLRTRVQNNTFYYTICCPANQYCMLSVKQRCVRKKAGAKALAPLRYIQALNKVFSGLRKLPNAILHAKPAFVKKSIRMMQNRRSNQLSREKLTCMRVIQYGDFNGRLRERPCAAPAQIRNQSSMSLSWSMSSQSPCSLAMSSNAAIALLSRYSAMATLSFR